MHHKSAAMNGVPNTPAPAAETVVQIWEETDNDWQDGGRGDFSIVKNLQDRNVIVFASNPEDKYPEFKENFQQEFRPVLRDDINGSFHCDYECADNRVWPAVSWTCFKIKEVHTATRYSWKQPTIHVKWDPESGRQAIHVFGLSDKQQKLFKERAPTYEERRCNPFTWHATFAHIILEQYDAAFWMLRDLVRDQEKARSGKGHQPKNFPLLHDIARHLFHFSETIEVAEHTLQALTTEQVHWRREDADTVSENLNTWLKTRQRIQYEAKRTHSLKTRSKSMNDRHQNEINLAFNLVSQSFGRDARSDSNMMKTVAVVSMVYLPGTFVSGLFGTNFFSFQADPPNTWVTSGKFWIYWVVTIPLTLLTVAVWAVWHYRGTYLKWSNNLLGKNSTGPDDPKDMPPVSRNGSLEKSGTFPMIQRMTTAFGLRNVQRRETAGAIELGDRRT
ncbi:hypothetical protein BJX99DRAFT_224681 [Aspergillus californicus]